MNKINKVYCVAFYQSVVTILDMCTTLPCPCFHSFHIVEPRNDPFPLTHSRSGKFVMGEIIPLKTNKNKQKTCGYDLRVPYVFHTSLYELDI